MKLDLRCVKDKIEIKENDQPSMTFEEIQKRTDELNKRQEELLKLDNESFLSPEVTKEMNYINNEILRLIKMFNKS